MISVPGQISWLSEALAEEPSRRRSLSPSQNQPHHDLVDTPHAIARQIVDYYQPSGRLLDPCRGHGAFFDAMSAYSDDVRWCEIREGTDFLLYQKPADWIITNPPWSKFRDFLEHAMELAPNVVFFATLVHFCTKARLRDMERLNFSIAHVLLIEDPPPPWPASGFQPAAVLVKKNATSLFIRQPLPLVPAADEKRQ